MNVLVHRFSILIEDGKCDRLALTEIVLIALSLMHEANVPVATIGATHREGSQRASKAKTTLGALPEPALPSFII